MPPGKLQISAASGIWRPVDARNQGRGAEPLVFALAGMHVQIETATQPAPVIDVPGAYLGVPDGGVLGSLEADVEEPGRGFENALLYGSIREIGTDRLRIEIEGCPAILLIPIAAVAALERREPGLLPAGKGQHHLVFLFGACARSLLQLADELLHVGRRAHHLVGCGQVGPGGKSQDGGHLLPHREQIQQ